MTKYLDQKTLETAKKVELFTTAGKKSLKTDDGTFFAIIAAVFVISSAVVWLHDLGVFWSMPTW